MRALWILAIALAAEAQTGGALYLAQCAMCHGPEGEGGSGPTLQRPRLRHAPDDAALHRVIRRGIAGTAMPGTALSGREIQLVATHVRTFGQRQAETPSGNAARGEAIYLGKGGCAGCHTLRGRGGAFGPDLTGIGEKRSAAYLRASLTDPGRDVPRGLVVVRAVTATGGTLEGMRVNEDTFSVQFRDVSGKLHSFWKQDLRSCTVELGRSLMPSYTQTLSGAEIDDVVAFLAALTEAP